MPGLQSRSSILSLERSLASPSRASNVNDDPQDALKPESKRSPRLNSSDPSAKFDKQVAVLPIRFQAMTRIAQFASMQTKPRANYQRSFDDADHAREDDVGQDWEATRGNAAAAQQRGTRKTSFNGQSRAGGMKGAQDEQPVGLVVALFHDGFVCRHINKENECVEGFAQPYDAESRCIACAHYNGSVLAEIRDFREMRSALCPVSSAFLPPASALPQTGETELDASCRVWKTLLLPGKSPLPIHAQQVPTLQSMFDHFPDVTPSELETLAIDAKRQLLQEEDVLLSSSSTESSSPRDESGRFFFFSEEPSEASQSYGDGGIAGLTTTPTTRSRLQSGLEASPPASLLSPIERKSARSNLNGQDDTSSKRCQRQIQTKVGGVYKLQDSPKADLEAINVKDANMIDADGVGPGVSYDQDMELCESPRYNCSQQYDRGFCDMLADDTIPITPLPATQLFLSKLKGKRRRPENELMYGKPAWVTIAQVGSFFRAAKRLEREHSRFVLTVAWTMKVNARRLMQAEKSSDEETEVGSLLLWTLADAREIKTAEDEGRKIREPDWMDNGERSPSPTWQSVETAVALVTPDSEAALHFQRIDTDDDILLGHFFELATDTASMIKDYQPTAAAPHFNAFDDDGNLQLQFA
ncbi:unnamed protein product [Phytophthora lilii]|uniref:Unnamed protein product n=1 Tax=Phytophthora lilii TaxID=2077276 RepID=A0A9W6WTR2_9STRA|nr:unnamed protein product [Phytophthora lilii]